MPRPALPRIYMKRGRDQRLRAGHLWVYASEVGRAEPGAAPGDAVDLVDHRGRFLARGTYNPASQIVVRVMTRRRDEPVDAALVRRRIAAAVAYRRRFYDAGETCRLVFGEGDLLPGLAVDRYGPCLVVQITTLGIDRLREEVADALMDAVHPRGIFERSDLPVRAREGLEPRAGLLRGEVPASLEVVMDGLRFEVDPRGGQKTGLYLDHRLNRRAVQAHAAGRRALDVFCNAGAFALYALAGGAGSATGIEIAPEAVAAARANAERNGRAGACTWIEGNAFDVLRDLERRGERFDLIVLDPPAFTKSAQAIEAARRGYKEINLRALRLASPGAVLLTSSCSYHMGPEDFLAVVRDAAADAGRDLTLLEMRGQAPDHPINLAVPETRYLKCALLEARR